MEKNWGKWLKKRKMGKKMEKRGKNEGKGKIFKN